MECAKSKKTILLQGPPERIRAGYMVMIAILLTSRVVTSLFGGFLFILCICDAGDGTQCPMQARQEFNPMSCTAHITEKNLFFIFFKSIFLRH